MSDTRTLTETFRLCQEVWVQRWFHEFSDNKRGGFYERLGEDGTPMLDLPRRLLTQCRQIMVYSGHCLEHPNQDMADKVASTFQFICDRYRDPVTTGFHFSLDKDGNIADSKYDLYGHAFVLLACAAMYKTFGGDHVLQVAKETLTFIDQHFRLHGAPGLAESLNSNLEPEQAMRRQNPHMHMMEACVYMHDASRDPAYLRMADEMLSIFRTHLINQDDFTLREFFDGQLKTHPQEGHIVEAGHHSEWVWLLKRYQETTGQDDPVLTDIMKSFFTWVSQKGFDVERGGIFNSQASDGAPVDANKRIWPVLETLRAAAIMEHVEGFQETSRNVIEQALNLLDLYISDSGVWTEVMTPDLKPAISYRRGTTPYHIALPMAEAHHYKFG